MCVWIRTRCYSGSPTTAARTLCCVDPRTAKCSCFPSALLLSQTTTMTPGPSVRCCLQGRLVATTSCQQYMMLLTPQHQLPIETTPHTSLLGNMQCALQQQTESVLQCCTREHTGHLPCDCMCTMCTMCTTSTRAFYRFVCFLRECCVAGRGLPAAAYRAGCTIGPGACIVVTGTFTTIPIAA